MKVILWNLRKSLLELFPNNKLRLILISLSLLAASISVSELLVAKFFTEIILHEGELSRTELIIFVVSFFLFYGITRAGQFFQRIYRLRVFEKAFKASDSEITNFQDNWRWSLAIELTNILATLTQLGVVVLFFIYFNPVFGLVDLIIVLIVLQLVGRIFAKQIKEQRNFANARKLKKKVSPADKFRTRIKSGEVGILYSGVAMIILLGLLLYLSYQGEISPANTVVLFFGLRLQNSGLSSMSTSLMRFARARTHSE
jgi:hypothetical protein